MITFRNYIRPQSLEEAYELCQKKSNVVLGGMLWLKMENKNYVNAVDLSDLGLDKIQEQDGFIHIGAYVSLRALETDKRLNELTSGVLKAALSDIVGVQFRNSATLGGSIYGRFGFSDVLTVFSVLGARVKLYKGGIMSLEDFISYPRNKRDILTEVIIPAGKISAAFVSRRNSATDFSVLCCGVSEKNGEVLCAVGGRPAEALLIKDEEKILSGGITEEKAAEFGEYVKGRCVFGSNMRASALYREKICPVLVKRAVMKLSEGENNGN